jgi:hypothetical protein
MKTRLDTTRPCVSGRNLAIQVSLRTRLASTSAMPYMPIANRAAAARNHPTPAAGTWNSIPRARKLRSLSGGSEQAQLQKASCSSTSSGMSTSFVTFPFETEKRSVLRMSSCLPARSAVAR